MQLLDAGCHKTAKKKKKKKQEVMGGVRLKRDSPVHQEGYLPFFEWVNMFKMLVSV